MFNIRKIYLLLAAIATALALPAQVKSPDQFLPHRLGEHFTPHHLLTDYFEHLATHHPRTMRLERYGRTNEARPLQIAIFSSPENMARLEDIRLNHLRMTGAEAGTLSDTTPVAVVWLSMSVHGNEPSGSECSMLLAYQLATQTEATLREWLKNTVVIVDPSLNPDGYDRYTHWNRMAGNQRFNANPDAREHREPWPGGRTNHYYFDLNRDWAWATQVETRQRLAIYHRWLPHIHADLHEQGIDNPYYFAPAAEPTHAFLSQWQRDFQVEIGKNHARYFDTNGWLYFTKEVFDLLYPSYGDTYPMFNGAIGMTYEQAGNSSAGRAVLTSAGDTLTLADRIAHHLATSRSTIEMASAHAGRLVRNFREYYRRSVQDPPGKFKTYVISGTNDANKILSLTRLFDLHHITYGMAGEIRSIGRAFHYHTGQTAGVTLQPNDLVVSAHQLHGIFLQALMEPAPYLSDSLTYDITAWALPFARGLQAYGLTEKIDPKRPYTAFRSPQPPVSSSPYAWLAPRSSVQHIAFAGALSQAGVRVRTALRPFMLGDRQYPQGTLAVTRADNPMLTAELDSIVKAAAEKTNTTIHAAFTGFAGRGNDLGSEYFTIMPQPVVGIVYGDEVDDNAFGHLWYIFEKEFDFPAHAIAASRLERVRLGEYSVLILPHGNYRFSESVWTAIEEWVKRGGRLIVLGNAVRSVADRDGFAIVRKPDSKKDSAATPLPYLQRERDRISETTPGAVIAAVADTTHPLAAGLGPVYFTLKTSSDVYELTEAALPVLWIPDSYTHYGFIGQRLKPRLKMSPVAGVQPKGEGRIVYFVDDPTFRAFWRSGIQLLGNAVFY